MNNQIAEDVRRIAVLIPCFNEGGTVAEVVAGFRAALPTATVYVYDNNSTDDTAARAADAGATVGREKRQGKGYVLRRMFADIDADIYVLADGDGTYDAAAAPRLVRRLVEGRLAMVTGRRCPVSNRAYRPGHALGNRLFTRGVAWLFGKRFEDIFSGYRVFSRRFVKSFPAFTRGFEIETELTVHALTLDLPVEEMDTAYRERQGQSASKLRTYRDGYRVLRRIAGLVRSERPLAFYSWLGAGLIGVALVLAYPVVVAFLETGLVERFPTAILATGMVLAGLLSVAVGLILDAVTLGRREQKLLAYMAGE